MPHIYLCASVILYVQDSSVLIAVKVFGGCALLSVLGLNLWM